MLKSLMLSGLLVAAFFICGCGTVMFSPEVDAVLAKMKLAQDPEGKLASIHSKKIIGVFRRTTKEKPAHLTVLAKKPNMIKISLFKSDGESMQKGFDGKAGWRFITGKPLAILSGQQLNALHFLAVFRSPGMRLVDVFETIELKGESIEAGRKCYRFVCKPLSEFNLPSLTYYVDKETYLPVKRVESHRMPNGKILRIAIYLNKFSLVDGIMVPHNMVSEVNGQLMEVNVKSVEWNAPCSKEDFDAPTEL